MPIRGPDWAPIDTRNSIEHGFGIDPPPKNRINTVRFPHLNIPGNTDLTLSKSALEPVFQAMLENATRICEAKFGVLNLYENEVLRMGAMHNVPPAFAEWLQNQRGWYRPMAGSPLDNVMRTKQLSVTVDHAVEASPGRATTLGGARSTVCVPMIKQIS